MDKCQIKVDGLSPVTLTMTAKLMTGGIHEQLSKLMACHWLPVNLTMTAKLMTGGMHEKLSLLVADVKDILICMSL